MISFYPQRKQAVQRAEACAGRSSPKGARDPNSPPQQKHQLVSRWLPETPDGESRLHVEALAANSDQLLAVVLFHLF